MNGEQFLIASGLTACPDNKMPVIRDNKTGDFIAINFDLAKPGNYFYDLTKYLNVMQGEAGYQLPVQFTRNGIPLPLDANTDILVKGNSSAMVDNTIYCLPKVQTNDDGTANMIFPPDMFRTTGKHSLIFQISQNGAVYKTAPFVLNVAPEMVSVSANFKNGMTPYDSEFDAWRAKIRNELTGLTNSADGLKSLVQQYQDDVNNIVAKSLNDVPKLDTNNTFTGINQFAQLQGTSLTLTDKLTTAALIIAGKDISATVTNSISNNINGSLMNGISWGYINICKYMNNTAPFAIISAQFNIPNNATFQNASEAKPVVVAQFPKGSCASMGQTIITMSGAEFKFDVADDTLLFCGLVTNTFSDWGCKVRDVKATAINPQ